MIIHFWGTRGSLPGSITEKTIKEKIDNALKKSLQYKLKYDSEIENFINEKLTFSERGTFGNNTSCVEIKDKNLNSKDLRTWQVSFLYYDYYVSWSKDSIKYVEKHPVKVNKFYNIGCIWSELIHSNNIRKEKIFLETKKLKGKSKKDLKILSFFDKISKGFVSNESPARIAVASPNFLCVVGFPRRKSSSSIAGRSSCTSEYACIISTATAQGNAF